ncbi:hypothetical protein NE237_020402 [Protea cynaroides]|uniref:Uncharacterized protein n=1 Tax=Protea cynaroides TaxID=273540 RepID=A0A9Q0HAG8_9MAGN|nr:hypothetical protein NE237_020402 [Protea cynaroides]
MQIKKIRMEWFIFTLMKGTQHIKWVEQTPEGRKKKGTFIHTAGTPNNSLHTENPIIVMLINLRRWYKNYRLIEKMRSYRHEPRAFPQHSSLSPPHEHRDRESKRKPHCRDIPRTRSIKIP